MRILILFLGILLSSASLCVGQTSDASAVISFREGSDMLFDIYRNNKSELDKLNAMVAKHEDVILTGNGHIRFVANIPVARKEDIKAVNLGALRAAVISTYLRGRFRFLTKWNFSFFVDPSGQEPNSVSVSFVDAALPLNAPRGLFFTEDKDNIAAVRGVVAKYGGVPYLKGQAAAAVSPKPDIETHRKATDPVAVGSKEEGANPSEVLIAIYFRWDKSNLDSLYLSNPEHLSQLDSLLRSPDARYIDTLTIVAFASPEGHPDYNRRLSERRAATIRDYIVGRYPNLARGRIVAQARGENWEGVLKFAKADPDLPSRQRVLEILTGNMTDLARQQALTALDGGATYYRYILPNYYRYLRNGASVFITYSPDMPRQAEPEPQPTPEPQPVVEQEPPTTILDTLSVATDKFVEEYTPLQNKHIHPLAVGTNLLFDAMGAPNISVEVPIGKRFSVAANFAYAYVRTKSNIYCLQTRQGGIDVRYWFAEHDRTLLGWNIGAYGLVGGRGDIRLYEGYQTLGFWSAGLFGGYSARLWRNFSLDMNIGFGFFYTNQYMYYHRNDEGVLLWELTDGYANILMYKRAIPVPTRLEVKLTWLIPFKKQMTAR